jgi:hypothetical protein
VWGAPWCISCGVRGSMGAGGVGHFRSCVGRPMPCSKMLAAFAPGTAREHQLLLPVWLRGPSVTRSPHTLFSLIALEPSPPSPGHVQAVCNLQHTCIPRCPDPQGGQSYLPKLKWLNHCRELRGTSYDCALVHCSAYGNDAELLSKVGHEH